MTTGTPPLSLRVESVSEEAQDIRAFRLATTDGTALPPFTPGAHLRVHGRRGGAAAVGSCSLVNGPADLGHCEVGVLRGGRAPTNVSPVSMVGLTS